MSLLWAARGRSWGFRFLADGGYSEPLRVYEKAFRGVEGDATVFRPFGGGAVFRLPDPLERRDDAGRVLTHDIVSADPLLGLGTLDDAFAIVWPRLAPAYEQVWDRARPPTRDDIQALLAR